MNEQDENLIARVRSSAHDARIDPPDPTRVIAAGRRRRRKDRLLASGAAVVIALGVVLPLRALLPVGSGDEPGTVGKQLPKSCSGYKVDIYAVEDDRTYEGTPGDDIVIQGGTASYRDNGGLDILCGVDGQPLSVSTDGHPELMELGPKALNEAVRKIIDAEPITGEDDQPPPTEVAITCDGTDIALGRYTVQPLADGVHLRIDHGGGTRGVAFWDRGDDRAPITYSATELDPAETTWAGPLPFPEPGEYFVTCLRTDADTDVIDLDPARAAPLDVIDVEALWASDQLRCQQRDLGFHEVGPELSADTVRAALPGVLPSDTVRPLGYPDAGGDWWGVIRDGTLLARFDVFDFSSAERGWVIFEGDACTDSEIGKRYEA